MLTVPEVMKGITHPMVASMYLKKDYSQSKSRHVLIIQTNYGQEADAYDGFDSYLMDLLADLPELHDQAEKAVGHFDRIEIRA